jgi:hypothetical protein
MAVHLFGVRHHGPGSARSLDHALARLEPDVILLEGPPEADGIVALAGDEAMRPPIAILIYRPDAPGSAVFYPFAEFSPEWRALRFAAARGVPFRFIDLPQAQQLVEDDKPEPVQERVRADPLGWLAETTGYEDAERMWEHLVEHRRGDDDALFAAIGEVMRELRDAAESEWNAMGAELPSGIARERERDTRREAHMRQKIRAAKREGFERIAVICGAWHVPALDELPPASHDAALLKGLPKTKVEATWVPWTNSRLAASSGYGAGIESPGWYHHLWTVRDRVAERWLARVAMLLREQDLDASPAQIIDASRLAESLASMRGRTIPGLAELMEATKSVFCFGGDAPLRLIARTLVVGEVLGAVPENASTVPLAQDVAREQRRLRLQPEAVERVLDLDLRKENDLARSRLLHRLALLDVPWGNTLRVTGHRGTFREQWMLRWQPEFVVRLIESAVWGNTVVSASTAKANDAAQKAADIPALTELLQQVILADLGDAVGPIVDRLQAESAKSPDIAHLMGGLPPLATVLRYSDVRRTDVAMLTHVVDGFVARICIGLPAACASLDDDAAAAMRANIDAVSDAIALLKREEHLTSWRETLRKIADAEYVHGLVAARATRLLFDAGVFDAQEVARRVSLALSAAQEPPRAAAWIEGFLGKSGLLLLHDDVLWNVIDTWLARLPKEAFTSTVPLLRRTFSSFPAPERRQLAERASRVAAGAVASKQGAGELDIERAELGLQTVMRLLGL